MSVKMLCVVCVHRPVDIREVARADIYLQYKIDRKYLLFANIMLIQEGVKPSFHVVLVLVIGIDGQVSVDMAYIL